MISPTESRCGDCTVCCEIMGYTGEWSFADKYKEANKYGVVYGEWSSCNKLCETGCSIQEDKPRICDEFFCHFIKHDLEDEYRPDKFGFVARTKKGVVDILSTDKTLPPEIQYDNNKKMLDNLIDDVSLFEGTLYEVHLFTSQGSMKLR